LTVLAGVGLAQMASWGREWLIGRSMPVTAAAATSAALAVAWWSLASSQVWNGATFTAYRHWMHESLVAASFVAHGPATCGVGLYGLGDDRKA
jgi:hypothetical protein